MVNKNADIINSKLLDEMINSIKYSYKNLFMGSRTVLTPDGAYTEIWHDNKKVAICHPKLFLRLVKKDAC